MKQKRGLSSRSINAPPACAMTLVLSRALALVHAMMGAAPVFSGWHEGPRFLHWHRSCPPG